VHIEREQLGPEAAIGPGGAIVLWARTGHTILGASAVAERGVPAERLAEGAARALRAELDAGATLDVHAADQLLVYCALAAGASQFLVRDWSSHARTTAWLLPQFFPVRVHAAAHGALTRVTIEPA
jgi:RNA 3'-terminal phosphate cyclase